MKTRLNLLLCAVALAPSLTAAPSNPPRPQTVKPLSYQNVVSHFNAAKFRATEVQKRCTIFFEGEWKNPGIYDYCIIIVENSDEDVQVTFYLTDAHEMNWVTEFLDAPFFSRKETEQLFRLVHSNKDVRGQNLGRFRVDFHHWQPRHAELLVFSFTPLRSQ
jgi:hypothetical protein